MADRHEEREQDRSKKQDEVHGQARTPNDRERNQSHQASEPDGLEQSSAPLASADALCSALMSAAREGIVVLSPRLQIESINRPGAAMLGIDVSPAHDELDRLVQGRFLYLNGSPMPDDKLPFNRALHTGRATNTLRFVAEFPDGHRALLSASALPVPDETGHIRHIILSLENSSVREETRAELKRINRALRIVTACNQDLVRAKEEPELLRTICHSIEREGGFPLVWVGYAEDDARKTIRPVSWAGRESDYLAGVNITWDDKPTGCGPVGKSVRFAQSFIIQNVTSDPDFARWRERAVKHRLGSLAALPLIVDSVAVGVLVIYSTQADAFREAEADVLEQLAADLSYGIGALRSRQQQRETRTKLLNTAEQLKLAVSASNTGLWDWDLRTNAVYFSPEWKRQLGYEDDEIAYRFEEWEKRVHPEDLDRAKATVSDFLADPKGGYENEFRMRHKDGSYRWILARASLFHDDDGNPVRMLGSHVDVTGQKLALQELKHTQELLAETGRLAKIGGWEFDPATGDGVWTEEVARIHELDPAIEATAKLGLSFYHGESRARIDEAIKQAVETATPYDLVLEMTTAKGNHRWVRTVGRPVVQNGKVVSLRGYFQDVTEVKHTRDEIARLARFPAQNPYPVLRIDEEGTILYANPATQALLPSWHCRTGESVPDRIAAIAAQALLEDRILDTELECDERTILFAFAPVTGDNTVNIYGFDITARKTMEQSLARSERRLTEAMDLANAAEWEFDLPTGEFTFNDRFYALYGTTAEREGGYRMSAEDYASRFLYPEDAHLVAAEVARAMTEADANATWQLEHRIRTRDGRQRFIIVRITTIKNAQGHTIATHGVNQDITERRLAEDERARLAIALEQAAESVVMTNAQGEITYANSAFERITGYTRAEVMGQNPRILKSGEQDDVFYNDLWKTLGRGEVWSGKLKNRRKDGKLYDAEMAISPVHDESGSITSYVAIQRDVTDELALERRVSQSQKLEAIGTLAGGIAHDFNNILGAILGYGQLIAEAVSPGSETHDDITELLKAAHRATDLVRQILAFSRRSEEDLQVIEVGLIAKEALKLLRPSLPATIEIRADIDDTGTAVLADPTQIHQVLMNLCTNSYHSMREKGGTLTVSLKPYTVDAATAGSNPDLRQGDYVRLTVADTGHGISPENLERVLEPFFTTKEQGEGTGLGLSTVHGIVTSHGGALTIYSEVGAGTTVHAYLPQANREGQAEAETIQDVPPGHERILLIDDEAALVRILERGLRKLGYAVTSATSPVDALAQFKSDPTAFDIIISDLTMPKMTGLEFTAEIRTIRPDLPFVIASGHADDSLREKIAGIGVSFFLAKPIRVPEVAHLIRSILDS